MDSDNKELAVKLTKTSTSKGSTLESPDGSVGGRPFRQTIKEAETVFKTDLDHGLTEAEAKKRLEIYGPNSFIDEESVTIVGIIINQTFNAMILILIIAMAIAFGIQDWISGGVILFVILLNVVVGTWQEYGAEKTMSSLKSLSTPSARIVRDAADRHGHSGTLVPGDIIILKMGDTVPADVRLIEAINLDTDEALLTGESLPVSKKADISFDKDVPVGDRINMAFSSSQVVKGRGKGLVVATGMNTEIGKIAVALKGDTSRLRKVERRPDGSAPFSAYAKTFFGSIKDIIGDFLGITSGTPLQVVLSKMAIILFFVSILWAIVVLAANKFNVTKQVGIYAICVALSQIPASLTVVLTMTLSVGARVMAKRNVLIRTLDSLEVLGNVTNICSDKTGTLTQGRMVTRRVWIPRVGTFNTKNAKGSGTPYPESITFDNRAPADIEGTSTIKYNKQEFPDVESAQQTDHFFKFVRAGALDNGAIILDEIDEHGKPSWKGIGEPTEIALMTFVTKVGYPKHKFINELNYQFLTEFPFDSSIKRMTTVYENDGQVVAYTKGATERVVALCDNWYGPENNEAVPLDDTGRKYIEENMMTMTRLGLRVLALCEKVVDGEGITWNTVDRARIESHITFIGLVGIYDPPREETAGAVKSFKKAGIDVHMLTGDHPGTASAIAKEIGLLDFTIDPENSELVITGQHFDDLTVEEIDNMPQLPKVIARCSPQTKVKMIEALHRRKKVVAMTGDGVNDSPSLKIANVGIAMGINGSDVAKDASDIVLADDNFASILNAVEEGRRISDNIQKFILHLLACNVGQTIFLLCGLAFKDSTGNSVFPISPVEVLWVIMVTSSFPAMGLGVEQAQRNIMQRKPRANKSIFTTEIFIDILVYGLIMAILCMVSFVIVVYGPGKGELGIGCNDTFTESCRYVFRGRSTAFVIMTWSCLILAFEVIDMRISFFKLHDNEPQPAKATFLHIYNNKFLFWSVLLAALSVFPVIYIPVINYDVFIHAPITWEWGVAFAFGIFIFLLSCELYKFFKRVYIRKHDIEIIDTPLSSAISIV